MVETHVNKRKYLPKNMSQIQFEILTLNELWFYQLGRLNIFNKVVGRWFETLRSIVIITFGCLSAVLSAPS